MCFSPEGSFGLGAALIAAGGYCVWRSTWPLHPLAAVPAAFGVQQIAEGFVWVALETGRTELVRPASLAFLLFALAVWPVWVPASAAWLESRPDRRRVWWAFTGLGVGMGALLYLPLLFDTGRYLTVEVAYHTIRYDYTRIPLFQVVPRAVVRAVYLATCAVPLVLSSDRSLRGFGVLLVASAAVTEAVFWYSFTSVWCFFAAALSLYLCRATRRSA